MILIVKGKADRALCVVCKRLKDVRDGMRGSFICQPCEQQVTDASRWWNDVPDRRRKIVRVMCVHCEQMYTLTTEERKRALDGRDAYAICPECRTAQRSKAI